MASFTACASRPSPRGHVRLALPRLHCRRRHSETFSATNPSSFVPTPRDPRSRRSGYGLNLRPVCLVRGRWILLRAWGARSRAAGPARTAQGMDAGGPLRRQSPSPVQGEGTRTRRRSLLVSHVRPETQPPKWEPYCPHQWAIDVTGWGPAASLGENGQQGSIPMLDAKVRGSYKPRMSSARSASTAATCATSDSSR